MARYLKAWDCKYCGTKRLLGNVRVCPNCNKVRELRVVFYKIDNAPDVTPEIAAQLGSGGPNWYCSKCGSGNKDTATTCEFCKAEKGTKYHVHRVTRYEQGTAPTSTEEAESAGDSYTYVDGGTPKPGTPTRPKTPEASSPENYGFSDLKGTFEDLTYKARQWYDQSEPENRIAAIGVGAGIILFVLFIWNFFFNLSPATATVTGFSWEQSVTVYEYQAFRESRWTTYPPEAYNVSSVFMDTGRDEKIIDGYKTEYVADTCSRTEYEPKICYRDVDYGDGSGGSEPYDCGSSNIEYYSCTKPVTTEIYHFEDIYDWHHTYNINRWSQIGTYFTNGNDRSPYYSNSYRLNNQYLGGNPILGQQKSQENIGRYSVTFYCESNQKVGDKGYFTIAYDYDTWARFLKTGDYEIKVNFMNVVVQIPNPN